MAEDCLFCKIRDDELPSTKIEEDEHTVAFLDINPWTRGHALVIPRNHSRNIFDVDETDLDHAMRAARRLAVRMRERLGCDGVNVFTSAEPAAWQTIFHLHLHVIPRYDGDPLQLPTRPRQADPDELASLAEELRD